ncbi:MAG: hypothetical protein MJE68_20500 [Proteobacteria bacterium]|nr:hypothetical protein [Pseudomonadota bacterium]
MHRHLELEIWRFSCRRRQQQRQTDKPIALPLAHARGVIIQKTGGSLSKGQAVDGKLKSHLVWPNVDCDDLYQKITQKLKL